MQCPTFDLTLEHAVSRSERVKQFADDIIECYQRASDVPSSGRFEAYMFLWQFELKTIALVSGNGGKIVVNAPRWFRLLG